MKKILFLIAAAAIAAFSGCKKVPSVETIGTLSKTIGYAAGMAADLGGVTPGCRKTMIEVLDIVGDVVPATNQTFTAAWTPVIKENVDKFVAAGKIKKEEGDIIVLAGGVVTSGLDYMFEVRWPKAKEYKELVSAGTKGFIEGFKLVINSNVEGAKGGFNYDKDEYDKAMEYFKANKKK